CSTSRRPSMPTCSRAATRGACWTESRSRPYCRCPPIPDCSRGSASCSWDADRLRHPSHSFMPSAFTNALRELAETADRVATQLGPDLERAHEMVRETVQRSGTLFFCGNGGSAADAQHIATEYVVRYTRNRRAYPAIALTTDTSLLTAAGNDLGFEHVFARQVEALAKPGDLLVIHSTSGNSP